MNLHTLLGLPWWALVPLVTFGFRGIFTLPLAILNRKRQLRLQSVRPILDLMLPILKFNLMRKAHKSTSNAGGIFGGASNKLSYEQVALLSAKERRKRQKALYKEKNCQTWKNFTLPLAQFPLWVTLSLTIRNLSGWDSFFISATSSTVEPSLVTGGCLWITDLSHSDPYGILPVLLGLTMISNIELLARSYPGTHTGSFVKDTFSNRLTLMDSIQNISRLLVVVLMGISSQAPAILSLYWLSSNAFSLAQNVVFNWLMPLRENWYESKAGFYVQDKLVSGKQSVDYITGSRGSIEKLPKFSDNEVEELLKNELQGGKST